MLVIIRLPTVTYLKIGMKNTNAPPSVPTREKYNPGVNSDGIFGPKNSVSGKSLIPDSFGSSKSIFYNKTIIFKIIKYSILCTQYIYI